MVVIRYYDVGCKYRPTDPLQHGILVGIKGRKYETSNYETSTWHFYAGSPMAITLGQQYTVGEKYTNIGPIVLSWSLLPLTVSSSPYSSCPLYSLANVAHVQKWCSRMNKGRVLTAPTVRAR